MQNAIIPSFFLYGEPPREVEDHFLHLEPLDDRSRPSNWNIRPHAHTDLNHIFSIATGGGEMRAEGVMLPFAGPCLMLIPARVIHAFVYDADTTGAVLTLSETYLSELRSREPELGALFAAPGVLKFVKDSREGETLSANFARLAAELAWRAPGHGAAVESCLLGILVAALRLDHRDRAQLQQARGPYGDLVAGFRRTIEETFHANKPIADYAAELKVSESRLRTACLKVAHRSPLQLIQDRVLLEAKRLLLYSNMTVAEAGYFLGFEDPAYFTRFFTRRSGCSPRTFRARQSGRQGL